MDRRLFLGGVGTSAALVSTATPAVGARPQARAMPRRGPLKLKLGCQSGPSTEERFAFFARYGVTNSAARARTSEGRLHSTVDELLDLRRMAERHKLSLDVLDPVMLPSSHIDREANPAIMLADSPQRDRDIEQFQMLMR